MMPLTFDFDIPVAPEMAAGLFRGGPLDGQRHQIPAYGPAWVRFHADGLVHWYAWKQGSKRTYNYVGETLRSKARRVTRPGATEEKARPSDLAR